MELEGLDNLYQQARTLKKTHDYIGNVELYLLRYRTRTNKKNSPKGIFPVLLCSID